MLGNKGNSVLNLVRIWPTIVFTADVIYTCNFWDVDQGVSLLALNVYVSIKEDVQVVSVNTYWLWTMTVGVFFFGRLGRRVTL